MRPTNRQPLTDDAKRQHTHTHKAYEAATLQRIRAGIARRCAAAGLSADYAAVFERALNRIVKRRK